MKKVERRLLSFLCIVCMTTQATNVTSKDRLSYSGQQARKLLSLDEKKMLLKAALEEYTGTFDFDDFPSMEIYVDKEDLYAETSHGKSVLKKAKTKDTFEIVDYQGTLQFNRDENRKISSVELNAQGFTSTGIKR